MSAATASPALASAKLIDPAALMTIRSLELRARSVVEGFWSGMHRSPYHGFSVEFTEYRQYTPGDDPRCRRTPRSCPERPRDRAAPFARRSPSLWHPDPTPPGGREGSSESSQTRVPLQVRTAKPALEIARSFKSQRLFARLAAAPSAIALKTATPARRRRAKVRLQRARQERHVGITQSAGHIRQRRAAFHEPARLTRSPQL